MLIKSELDGDRPRFQRLYICLGACKKCHIKGPYSGKLLSTFGIDANNGMYPIAYAVAKVENFSTWMWFLEILAVDLKQ